MSASRTTAPSAEIVGYDIAGRGYTADQLRQRREEVRLGKELDAKLAELMAVLEEIHLMADPESDLEDCARTAIGAVPALVGTVTGHC